MHNEGLNESIQRHLINVSSGPAVPRRCPEMVACREVWGTPLDEIKVFPGQTGAGHRK